MSLVPDRVVSEVLSKELVHVGQLPLPQTVGLVGRERERERESKGKARQREERTRGEKDLNEPLAVLPGVVVLGVSSQCLAREL